MTKPTGNPVGRPKTKEYSTLLARVPQDLVDRVKRYASVHRSTVADLIRDGVEWRITDGDPRSLGVPAPQRARSDDSEYSRNTRIQADVREAPAHAGMLEEIRTALARQEAQLHALTQALEHHAVVPPAGEYFGNTTHTPSSQQRTPEPVQEGDAWHTPQEAHAEGGHTVFQDNGLAFDPARFYLGQLCLRGHAYQGTGQSLRRKSKGDCHECDKARKSEGRKAKRQAQPA